MQSHPCVAEMKLPVQTTKVEAASLYAVLQGVKDQRAKGGQSYEAALVLTLVLLAKLAGEQSLRGIAQWVQLRVTWFLVILILVFTAFLFWSARRWVHSDTET